MATETRKPSGRSRPGCILLIALLGVCAVVGGLSVVRPMGWTKRWGHSHLTHVWVQGATVSITGFVHLHPDAGPALEELFRCDPGVEHQRRARFSQTTGLTIPTSPQFRQFAVSMPLWLVYAILALWPVVCVIRGPMRRAIRMMRGQCETCGYSLHLCPSDRCPECRSPVIPAAIETADANANGGLQRT